MSPRCRRSARIASNAMKQRDSPAPNFLESVAEASENSELSKKSTPARGKKNTMASSTPNPTTPSARSKKRAAARAAEDTVPSPSTHPVTPSTAPPVKPPVSEMHPSRVHQTMAPPSSGLRNGFVDIDYTSTPVRSMIQNTPSKTPVPTSDFTFEFARPNAITALGPEARKMMEDLESEVAKNKVALAAEHARDLAKQGELGDRRKFAEAKGKKGRFSDVHMAEFKKMDSIAGHPSSFRANPNRAAAAASTSASAKLTSTPLRAGVKRSQSSANIDEAESARSRTAPRSLTRPSNQNRDASEPSSKRVRQHAEEDVSTLRPVSRDATLIPRPKSSGNESQRTGLSQSKTLGSIMTPTKSSLARSSSIKSPAVGLARSPSRPEPQTVNSFSAKVGHSLLKSPSKVSIEGLTRSPPKKGLGAFPGWGSKSTSTASASAPTEVATPGRFDRIKSILKRQPGTAKAKSSIPLFSSTAKTPERPGPTKPVAQTTPGRKQPRHVDFTADTKEPAVEQNTPSPVKSSVPRPVAFPKLPPPKFVAGGKPKAANTPLTTGDVTYPDLSAYQDDGDKSAEPENESVTSTFTFRSDHTIRFENSPTKGFGASPGQASLRQVRESLGSAVAMPGAFPSVSTEASPNKENKDPEVGDGVAHGLRSKKRHRAEPEESPESSEDEGAKRGAKKQRKSPSAAEKRALSAPKLAAPAASPKKAAGSKLKGSSPQKKKKGGMTLSRLQMLAQPKHRK